ncbi:MAG: DUF4838 domain-containing protein [Bacillota bacterium]
MMNKLDIPLIPEPKIMYFFERDGPQIQIKKNDPVKIAQLLLDSIDPTGQTILGKVQVCGLKIECNEEKSALKYNLDSEEKAMFDREGYKIEINDSVIISSNNVKGRFYGLQTLSQLIAGCNKRLPKISITDWPSLNIRGGHVCYHLINEFMPQLAPDFSGLLKRIKRFSNYKANTLLLEIEALFPYQKHPLLKSKEAFSSENINQLVSVCQKNHIKIIPLIQSLGHVYYVLRYPEYAHLREGKRTTQQYCPSNPDTLNFFEEIVEEIISAFGEIEYFHIGGDEARKLGYCERCKDKVKKSGIGELYGRHIGAAAKIISKKGIQPIVWTDIIEKYKDAIKYLPHDIIFDYWNYHPLTSSRTVFFDNQELKGKQVIASGGARFGSHNHTMYRYTRSMRGLNIMVNQSLRCDFMGHITTDWMKAVPYEFSLLSLVYGFALSWGFSPEQKEFEKNFSQLHYGIKSQKVADAFRVMQEPIPYCEDAQEHMVDRLDRYDLSGLKIGERIAKYTAQEKSDEVVNILQNTYKECQNVYQGIINEKENISHNRREFKLLILSLKTQMHKCKQGLIFDQAVARIKYPHPEDKQSTEKLIKEIKELISEWHQLRTETKNLLSEFNFSSSLENTLDIKFEPEVLTYLEKYRGLLENKKSNLPAHK